MSATPVSQCDRLAGVLNVNYWKGTLEPRPVVDWYLTRVDEAVAATAEEVDGPVTLLAHSAGGWLARVYLLGFGTDRVDRLVTLGSPHNPPSEGVLDQTRGILTHVNNTCPGNYHSELVYVTVAGKYIKGSKLFDRTATWGQRVVGAGYQSVCGDAEVWGDGVVPLPAAHLEGAKQLTLDGVYHSPLGALEAVEDGKPGRPWYGSTGVLDQWLEHVVVDASELRDFKAAVDNVAGTGRDFRLDTAPVLATLPRDGIAQALVTLQPCSVLQPHVHPRASEVYFVLEGALSSGFLEENGGRTILQNVTVNQNALIPQGLVRCPSHSD
ncbi:hypothetical protein WJX72_006040 [[Myrmecia] bisecta]|uniref:Cupin type-1 domain-containing protein n=1 Tax=[Myrmecia] bisecta TaxID=41462 RepID=A0AAW1R6W8_9CHLO